MVAHRAVCSLLAAAAVGAAGCGGGEPPASSFVATDSAGVAITESPTPSWRPEQRWTVDSVPLLDIGSADGDEPYLLNYAESAWRGSDGGVFFANTGTQEVRFFDSTGRFVKSFGRKGGGPGEFGTTSFMMMIPTTTELLVADETANRVNVYDLAGKFLRTVRFEVSPAQPRPNLVGVTGSDWVVRSSSGQYGAQAGVLLQDTVEYLRYQPDGSYGDTIASVVSQPVWSFAVGARGITFMSIPFTVESAVLVDSSAFVVRAADRAEIERWSYQGKLIARHRWTTGERRRVADVADRYYKQWLASSDSGNRRLIDAFYQSGPKLPEWVATHSRIAPGPEGTIWIQHLYFDWEPERRWDVLDRSGRWLGTVDMPARHWLYRAGNDYVLAWHRDELDVEHVTVHRLRRPRGPVGQVVEATTTGTN